MEIQMIFVKMTPEKFRSSQLRKALKNDDSEYTSPMSNLGRGIQPLEANQREPHEIKPSESLTSFIWQLLRPRWRLLLYGFVLMLINRASGLVAPSSSKYLIDLVIVRHRIELLLPILLIVLGATILQGGTSYVLVQVLSKEGHRLMNELREHVQIHMARLPVAFYDNNSTGALNSRIMSDVEGVRNLMGGGLIDFIGSIMTSLIALAVLLKINVAMALVAFAFVAAFSYTIHRSFFAIQPMFRQRRILRAKIAGRLNESLGGVRVIKSYRAEEREAAVFGGMLQKWLQSIFRTLDATAGMDFSSKLLVGGVSALVWYMGVERVISNHITLGDLVAFNLYLALLVAPLVRIVSMGTDLSEAVAGLKRTHELLQTRREDHDPNRDVQMPSTPGKRSCEIAFDEVVFAYEGGPEVLHRVSFHAAPGTVTALVGPSGSGKSTIIGLVAGFYTPQAGKVRVDGQDLSRLRLEDYRGRLGVVLQESFLFDGTIRENVLFSKPGASNEEFRRAARLARVDEFAERFKDGYDTIVGERGVKLSGGQRQRLSIARAILADPDILILDEATSSLDSDSEAMIQEGLKYLLVGRTTFVIAHRLSTIRAANQILVIDNGCIVERGTHTELLANGGKYYDLYTCQQGLDRNRFLGPGEGDVIPKSKKAHFASSGGEKEVLLPDLLPPELH